MILNHRGGYCFELNGLYSNLLKSLGFNVTNLAGRFANDETTIKMRSHRILKVTTNDGIYICDVWVRSESPRMALKLIDGLGISEYIFEHDDFYGHTFWQKEQGKSWKRVYGFTEEPQLDIDYVMPSFFCEKHQQSLFTGYKKISIFTDTTNITLVVDTLKFYENAKVIKKVKLKNEEEIDDTLEKYFRIKIDY